MHKPAAFFKKQPHRFPGFFTKHSQRKYLKHILKSFYLTKASRMLKLIMITVLRLFYLAAVILSIHISGNAGGPAFRHIINQEVQIWVSGHNRNMRRCVRR